METMVIIGLILLILGIASGGIFSIIAMVRFQNFTRKENISSFKRRNSDSFPYFRWVVLASGSGFISVIGIVLMIAGSL